MAKARAKVKVDVSELGEWVDELKKLTEKEYQEFLRQALLDLADEFVKKVMERTPKGKYPEMIEFTTRAGKKVSFKNPLATKQEGTLQRS